ncbi:hypothetical protein D3C78_1469170 [compost metagenome]
MVTVEMGAQGPGWGLRQAEQLRADRDGVAWRVAIDRGVQLLFALVDMEDEFAEVIAQHAVQGAIHGQAGDQQPALGAGQAQGHGDQGLGRVAGACQ